MKISWNKIKQKFNDRFFPKNLYIGYVVSRDEDNDGNIAGKQVYGSKIERISLTDVNEDVFKSSNFKNKYKIVQFEGNKYATIIIKSNSDYFINQEEKLALYRVCHVHGDWNRIETLNYDESELQETQKSMQEFVSDFVELVMGKTIGAKVKTTSIRNCSK